RGARFRFRPVGRARSAELAGRDRRAPRAAVRRRRGDDRARHRTDPRGAPRSRRGDEDRMSTVPSTHHSVTAIARALAGYRAPHGTESQLLPRCEPLDRETFDAVLARVVDEHVTGHFARAYEDGRFALTEAQRAALAAAHAGALALDLALERLL